MIEIDIINYFVKKNFILVWLKGKELIYSVKII